MRTDVAQEPFIEEVVSQAMARRERVVQHLSQEDVNLLNVMNKSCAWELWKQGFSIDDAVRYLLLTEEMSPHLTEEYALSAMRALRDKYSQQ